MKKRKIIPIITATFMAASLLVTNTAFADGLDCGNSKVNHTKQNNADYSGDAAEQTGLQYVKVEPSNSALYNKILGKLSQSNNVHCDTSAPIWAIRTPDGYYTAISKNSEPTKIDATNPANWQGGKAPDAYMEYVKAQQEYVVNQMTTTGIAPGALKAELSSLNDIDPNHGVSGKNIVGLEAFCKLICEECKCKDKECKHEPPETIPRRYFLDYPEYKHDKASRSDVAQKDMPMSWTMFDNSAKGTDGYPLDIQYSKEDPPSDGHIEKDVVITPFGEMMNKLRQGIGDYAKFKNPAPSVEATNAYQQELIQRAIEHKNRTDKTKTGITIPKNHAISKALAKGGIVRVQKII